MNHQAAPNSIYQGGYFLIEFAVVIALTLGVLVISFKGMASYQKYLARLQLKAAVNVVASDLIYLQQKSLFDGDISFYSMDTASSGYSIRKAGKTSIKKLEFSQIGCKDVYFTQYALSIAFSSNGRPKGNHYLELSHKRLTDVYYRIDIEPVTGRVVVHER